MSDPYGKSSPSPAHPRASAPALVQAFRDRGYSVVANSRSIKPSNDPEILAVAGDIADPCRPSASSAKPG